MVQIDLTLPSVGGSARLGEDRDMQLEEVKARIAEWTGREGSERDQLLPLLHDLQEELGYVDDSHVPLLAEALNLSRADIHGVLTFYHDYRRRPLGKHVIKLCRAESCQARGAVALERAATKRFGVKMGETRRDGQLSLEAVYCLGLCAIGPNALVNGRPVAAIDEAMLDRIAEEIAA